MPVLVNGVYLDYDITQVKNWEQILEANTLRQNYIGQQFGDFSIISIDYDWGTKRQINIAKCCRCGFEKEVKDLSSFKRGKGEGLFCKCRYTKAKSTYISPAQEYEEHVGETVAGFRLLEYQSGKGFRVECIECGKRKWASGAEILKKGIKCNHKIVNDYSDPIFIGKKIGSLTAMGYETGGMRFRCDCGVEIVRRASEVFGGRGAKSCGRVDCIYHKAVLYEGNNIRLKGLKFEAECAAELERQGISTEMTPGTGDYGVDFFATISGERVAFQCKRLKKESMVRAVQEVYAGGRYYDCCKFIVVSPSGFTYPAELMAQKLGVQLVTNLEEFCLKTLEENRIETQKIQTYSKQGLFWEIDGVSKPAEEWCREYGLSRNCVVSRLKNGDDLKTALTKPKYIRDKKKMIEINGILKSKQQWCDEYGISPQLYDYRIKFSKLSPLEALTKEKQK